MVPDQEGLGSRESEIGYQNPARAVAEEAKKWLVQAGWATYEAFSTGSDGLPWWCVFGINGAAQTWGDGATQEEAWLCAVEAARILNLEDQRKGLPGGQRMDGRDSSQHSLLLRSQAAVGQANDRR